MEGRKMDMYLTAIGYAMLRSRPDTSKPTSPAEEDAYYAQVGAPIMAPWVGRLLGWARANLTDARNRTTAAPVRRPVRHA
jgi:hypothetical protein